MANAASELLEVMARSGRQAGKSRFMEAIVAAAERSGQNVVVMTGDGRLDGSVWLLRRDNQRDAGGFGGEGW